MGNFYKPRFITPKSKGIRVIKKADIKLNSELANVINLKNSARHFMFYFVYLFVRVY